MFAQFTSLRRAHEVWQVVDSESWDVCEDKMPHSSVPEDAKDLSLVGRVLGRSEVRLV